MDCGDCVYRTTTPPFLIQNLLISIRPGGLGGHPPAHLRRETLQQPNFGEIYHQNSVVGDSLGREAREILANTSS